MPSRDCLAWLKEARHHLTEAIGPQTGPITIILANEHGQGVEFTLPPAEASGGRPSARFTPAEAPTGLTPLERQVLDVATAEPQTAKRLAGRLRRSCNSHFRDQLRALVRRGLLTHTADGYRLPA